MSTGTTPRDTGPLGVIAVLVATVLILAVVLIHSEREMALADEAERAARAEALRQEITAYGSLWVARIATDELPVDPSDERWGAVAATEVTLFKQTDTMPVLDELAVAAAEVRAVTDGERMVWRLAWPDPSADMNVDAGRFSDACALQFPVDPGASHTMGDRDHLVHILHWKGLWQHDVDEHFQDVQDLHPNYWADLYWFTEGAGPKRVPDDFSDPRSHAWFAAYSAGNPMADFHRTRPVEELAAVGFGSLTHHPQAATDGRGVWQDGHWAVTFVRPMHTDDPLDVQFWRGGTGRVSVAVWDGSAGNVGGRKQWANWLEFVVSP